jgi:CheY-like chemotaxis protein
VFKIAHRSDEYMRILTQVFRSRHVTGWRSGTTEKKASLLIVNNVPSIRMVLSQVLAKNGYTARSAADGFSALAEIQREVPDILISELNMPGMSGFELLRLVRRQFPSIRAIAISAFSGEEISPGVAADAFF